MGHLPFKIWNNEAMLSSLAKVVGDHIKAAQRRIRLVKNLGAVFRHWSFRHGSPGGRSWEAR